MYALVNDVESYPEFLPWCAGARIVNSSATEMLAEVDIGISGIRQSFSTRNSLDPPHRIVIALRNGPFSRLEGEWRFVEGPSGCTVDLSLDFAVSLSPLGFLLARVFEEIARSQIDAFIRRARAVYG